MTYKRWDVVSIDFPFVEGMDAKRRPGLIVSADRLRNDYGVYWIAMITTAGFGALPDDIPITNHERVGLKQACFIRVARLTTVNDALIGRKLGEITARDRTAVTGLLRRYMP